jgi:tetratricopeptide (TPR) repeat protein
MTGSRVRRWLLIAAVNVAVTLALFAAIELICRRIEQREIDAKLPAALVHLPPKRPGELRVFVFGGSTVHGVPVPEVGFVAQMQYWLGRLYPQRDIRLYNYSWWGEDTAYASRQVTRRIDAQPDLVIVISGHNEFLGSPPRGAADRLQEMLRARFATARLLRTLTGRMKTRDTASVMPCDVRPWLRGTDYFATALSSYERSMQRIVRDVTERGVPLIVGTLTANLSDWPPAYKRLADRDRAYADRVLQIRQLLAEGQSRAAADALRDAMTAYPNDAMMRFLRGQLQAGQHAYDEAAESFAAARDLDPVPYRAPEEINAIARRVASGVPGVRLVDLEAIYRARAENGLVGFALVADNVHGTPLGESITAAALIDTMIDMGLVPPRDQQAVACCPLTDFLADIGYSDPHSPLRLRAFFDNAKYAMKTPFLNLDASRAYLLEALKIDDQSWKIWANLATVSYLSGAAATGARELQRDRELDPAPFDLDDRDATPYLKEALAVAKGESDCDAPY